jgi:hypothetical protein
MTPDSPPLPVLDTAPPIAPPRRLLQYAGENWCSQLTVIGGRTWFKSCTVANKGPVDFWLWICDDPGASTRPTLCPVLVPAGTTQSIDRTTSPRLMVNGIYVCASSDPATRTLITGADAWFEVCHETELPPLV